MVAPKVKSIRQQLGILHDDEKWKEISKKAKEIFEACGGHRRCGEKSEGWMSLDKYDRLTAYAEVTPFNVDC